MFVVFVAIGYTNKKANKLFGEWVGRFQSEKSLPNCTRITPACSFIYRLSTRLFQKTLKQIKHL
jgi:hypothetical protein